MFDDESKMSHLEPLRHIRAYKKSARRSMVLDSHRNPKLTGGGDVGVVFKGNAVTASMKGTFGSFDGEGNTRPLPHVNTDR
jgi:hypothetical protein